MAGVGAGDGRLVLALLFVEAGLVEAGGLGELRQLPALGGGLSVQAQALLKTADTVRGQAVNDWNATSAVNKDEEAMNLVEFQNMYQANMKVISVANTLFDATLAMMG